MCLICVELVKGSMTAKEAKRARTEMTVEPEHDEELAVLIESTEYSEDAGVPRRSEIRRS